jgi:hypothetical protein
MEEDDEAGIEEIDRRLRMADLGIVEPYLCMFGLTTPGIFDELMTYDMASSGFLGRALVFRENDDNPRARKRGQRRREGIDPGMELRLRSMFAGGESETPTVARYGDPVDVETTAQGAELLEEIQDAFWKMADEHSEESGLTAIPRRGYELVAKVSILLAIPTGLRTVEHIQWAYALVRRDIETKIRMVRSNSETKPENAIHARVEELLKDGPMTLGKIHNRCQKWPAQDVTTVLEMMLALGHVRKEIVAASRGAGRVTTKWERTCLS